MGRRTWTRAFVPAVAALLAGCAFDQTGVPPLPESVTQFIGEDDDTGGSTDRPDTCPRDEPQLASFGPATGGLTGTWARRLVLRSERDTRATDEWKDSSWTVHEKVTVSHEGRRLREVVEVCGLSMPVIDGATTGFPERLIASLPVLAEDGDFLTGNTSGAAVGAAYANPVPTVRLYGLSPAAASKAWEPCKSYFNPAKLAEECPMALWPEIVDMDCDGNVGVTLDMTVGTAATKQLYMIQRDVMSRSGTVRGANRIDGTIQVQENNANLGATSAMLKSNPPTRAVDGSAFVMVRLPDGAGCDAVLAAGYGP